MGFYSASQLVQDARRHGVRVLPIDVTVSDIDCTLEGNPEPLRPARGLGAPPLPQPAVRLGLRLVGSLHADAAQRLLQARWQQGQRWIGPDAFFFEEGTAAQYEQPRYGEFRLQPDGATLLVGLRDQALKPIGHTRPAW